jgi:hypothetical protein
VGRHGKHRGIAAAALAMVMGAAVVVPATVARAAEPADQSLQAAANCLTNRAPVVWVAGNQNSRYTTDVAANSAVVAQNAMWLQVDNWPVSFTGGANACWLGGRIIGTFPQSTRWDQFHHTGGVNFQNDRFTLLGLRVHNYGDGIRVRDGARNFTISGAHLSFIHDDCIENDQLYSGTVQDSLLDGCYVAFSARPTSGDQVDGHTNTYTIRNNVVRLEAMPTVYKGKAPGHGGFFKWEDGAHVSPQLDVRDNVFRVDSRPNHQTLGLPAGYHVKCSNNVVVWLGKGRYPDRLPKCFRITRDRRVWDRAVARWRAAHPLNP